jgi:hypothetical protein
MWVRIREYLHIIALCVLGSYGYHAQPKGKSWYLMTIASFYCLQHLMNLAAHRQLLPVYNYIIKQNEQNKNFIQEVVYQYTVKIHVNVVWRNQVAEIL